MITRQRVFAFGAILTLTVSLAGYANAQGSGFIAEPSSTTNTDQISIPDFNPALDNAGNTFSSPLSTVTITADDVAAIDNGGNIVDVFFTIQGLVHSHASDLTVRVDYTGTGLNAGVNRTATLFERVGIEDDGTDLGSNGIVDNQNGDGIGATSNFSGSYRFRDDLTNGPQGDSLFEVANATADNANIATLNSQGTGAPFYNASGANNGQVSLLSAFGKDGSGNALTLPEIVGVYTFTFSDRSSLTTNTLVSGNAGPNLEQSFTRTNVAFQAVVPTNAIPEPGTATAMLIGLVGLAARRRKA